MGGDVPLSPKHSNVSLFAPQRTRTQDYLQGSEGGHDWCPGRPSVNPFVHYRLVLETLGRPLNRFKSTRQLCEVIRDAIIGKKYHFLLGDGMLHRDVSAGNILIGEDGRGILIDWDLSKRVTKGDYMQGTWQFYRYGACLTLHVDHMKFLTT
ncbi:hypothetical protein B0F90DRAFT_1835920 [Multifurca ochricompacta]|uniref:Fungal-type protein kinase domain-containing protein n=1 Tax=Multifurca ochricompacta TaxID=376703 RepID=A0AAD4LYL4_9AGAM|nr:hypothetical protein B0F90DRAFT_1835920 [Multifurca ochricompacta]